MIEKANSKWFEGLLLLIILIIAILLCTFAAQPKATHVTILEEQVSLWSGTIDNLD